MKHWSIGNLQILSALRFACVNEVSMLSKLSHSSTAIVNGSFSICSSDLKFKHVFGCNAINSCLDFGMIVKEYEAC